jgi:hypothetical protein
MVVLSHMPTSTLAESPNPYTHQALSPSRPPPLHMTPVVQGYLRLALGWRGWQSGGEQLDVALLVLVLVLPAGTMTCLHTGSGQLQSRQKVVDKR